MYSKNHYYASFRKTVRPDRRRGAVLILTVLLLIALFGMVAFSVDVAYMHLTRAKLRTATDAAARAAGEALSRTQSITEAREAAMEIAEANLVAGEPLVLADEDVVPGVVTLNTSGSWTFAEGGTPTNAMRVYGRRIEGSPSGPVPLFFGRVLGVYDFEPVQSATVVRLDRDICVVVDRSSSMKLYLTDTAPTMSTGDSRFCQPPHASLSRWSALAAALNEFVTALGQTPQSEYVSLVSYASAYTACSYSNHNSDIDLALSSNESLLASKVAEISARKFNGMTNIAAGIDDARVVLNSSAARPFAVKTMILMSDGHWNVGRDPVDAANDAIDENIVIHTVSFGEANEQEMREIAEASGSKHFHAPTGADLRDIYREIAFTLPVVMTE
jgi:hypothetical protein